MLVCNSFPSLSVQAALEHHWVWKETEGKDWVPCFPAHFGHRMWHAGQKQKHNLLQASGNFFVGWMIITSQGKRLMFPSSQIWEFVALPVLRYSRLNIFVFWIAGNFFYCFQMFPARPNRLIVKIISRVNNNENDNFVLFWFWFVYDVKRDTPG